MLSEVVKKRPTPLVIERLRGTAADALFTSSICVMELRFGAARHAKGPALWQRLRREVLSRVRVLAVGEPEAVRAAHGLVVATRDVRHLGRVRELDAQSWWE